jgi:hypothetical protein
MKEDEFVIGAADATEATTGDLYDRVITALSSLDATALINLEAECEQLTRSTSAPMLTSRAQFAIAEKHRVLSKLLVETRHNLRVLYPREAADSLHTERSWIDGREGATWLR